MSLLCASLKNRSSQTVSFITSLTSFSSLRRFLTWNQAKERKSRGSSGLDYGFIRTPSPLPLFIPWDPPLGAILGFSFRLRSVRMERFMSRSIFCQPTTLFHFLFSCNPSYIRLTIYTVIQFHRNIWHCREYMLLILRIKLKILSLTCISTQRVGWWWTGWSELPASRTFYFRFPPLPYCLPTLCSFHILRPAKSRGISFSRQGHRPSWLKSGDIPQDWAG